MTQKKIMPLALAAFLAAAAVVGAEESKEDREYYALPWPSQPQKHGAEESREDREYYRECLEKMTVLQRQIETFDIRYNEAKEMFKKLETLGNVLPEDIKYFKHVLYWIDIYSGLSAIYPDEVVSLRDYELRNGITIRSDASKIFAYIDMCRRDSGTYTTFLPVFYRTVREVRKMLEDNVH